MVYTQGFEGRRPALVPFVEEVHASQEQLGEAAQHAVALRSLPETGLGVAPRPVGQGGLILPQVALRHGRQEFLAQRAIVDVRIEQHGGQVLVTLHDAVDGVALGFQLFLKTEMDLLLIAFQELAIHVASLVEDVAPGLVQEAHEGEITARRGHLLAQAIGGGGAHAVKQVGKHQKVWGNQAARRSVSPELSPAFSPGYHCSNFP